MVMPKGKKIPEGYVTLDKMSGGMDYRAIAEEMTKRGHKMGHATVRNIILRIMERFVKALLVHMEIDRAKLDIHQIAKDPRFQNTIADLCEKAVIKRYSGKES